MKDIHIIASGEQSSTVSENNSLAKLALVSGGITAAGFFSYKGTRIWDKYVNAIRTVETGFPSAILRTFRISESFSILENYNKLDVPSTVLQSNNLYSDFLKRSLGASDSSITLKRSGLIFGTVTDSSNKVLGYGLNIEAGSQPGSAIADYFARVQGMHFGLNKSLNDALLRIEWKNSKSSLSYQEWLKTIKPHLRRKRLIIGSKIRNKINILGKDLQLSESMSKRVTKAETLGKFLRAKAAVTAGRLNILLEKPFETPIIGGLLEKIPGIRSMSVKPGTAMQTFTRLTGKALLAGAAWHGLEYIDYLRSEGSTLAPILSTSAGAGIGSLLASRPGMRVSKFGLLAGAAVGLAAGISPRTEEGLFYGAASIYADANVARAQLSETVGLSESLRQQEELTPGVISLGTALAFGGIGALALGTGSYASYLLESIKTAEKGVPFFRTLEKVREATANRMGEKVWSSTIGQKISKTPVLKHLTKIKSPIGLGLLGGLAAWQIFASGTALASGNILSAIPGVQLLGTTETPEELKAIYSGEQEVPVYKGRWWGAGRSLFEGHQVDYYRKHFLERLRTRSFQKGIYGSEEERWKYDPLLNPIKALFGPDEWKYHYELKHMYDRPAPYSGTYGENVPFFGPLVAETFGKLFKPRMKIRPEEWELGEGIYLDVPKKEELEPIPELGGIGPGAPEKPGNIVGLINELNYRRREAVGLVGFAEGSISKAISGREELIEQPRTIETMGSETGAEYWLWKHLNLGGLAGSTEAYRRYIPITPSGWETYNPLTNTMPSWMPEDYFIDFRTGSPFSKIPEAEIRLPGPGLAALYPELQGVDPEQYSLAWRTKVLGDVAMWSNEYKNTLASAKKNFVNMSEHERRLVQQTEEQVRDRKKKLNLYEYQFDPSQLENLSVTVSEVLSPREIKTKEFGDTIIKLQGIGNVSNKEKAMQLAKANMLGKQIELATPSVESRRYYLGGQRTPTMKAVTLTDGIDLGRLYEEQSLAELVPLKDEFRQLRFSQKDRAIGNISEKIMHGLDTPIEYLTPFAPFSKYIHQRDPIEEYVATRAVGTKNAFWDRPIENFIAPAADMMKYKAGLIDVSESEQERRDIEEYFDMLKWEKYSRLESKAVRSGDFVGAQEYRTTKESTLFGVDVFRNPVNVIRALPRQERDFFKYFSNAKTEENRKKILSIVPEQQQRVYIAQWMKQEQEASEAKKIAKIDTEYDDRVLAASQQMRKSEGFAYSEDLEEQWLRETDGKIPFDEWIRRKKADKYFATHSLPHEDSIIWNPAVDLDDVKLKYVEEAGRDMHDFDLWDDRKRALARKPYISGVELLELNHSPVLENARSIPRLYKDSDSSVTFSKLESNSVENSYNITISDARRNIIEEAYKNMGVRKW